MRPPLSPFGLILGMLAGWMNRDQQAKIDYLVAEIRILRAKIGKSKLRFTDAERRELARKGAPLGKRVLEAIVTG